MFSRAFPRMFSRAFSRMFSRASYRLHMIASSFDLLTGLSLSRLCDLSDWLLKFWFFQTQSKIASHKHSKECSHPLDWYSQTKNDFRMKIEFNSQDWFGTPIWPPFLCFEARLWPLWRHVKTREYIPLTNRVRRPSCEFFPFPAFFPFDLWPARFALGKKTSGVHNLLYGPRKRG